MYTTWKAKVSVITELQVSIFYGFWISQCSSKEKIHEVLKQPITHSHSHILMMPIFSRKSKKLFCVTIALCNLRFC